MRRLNFLVGVTHNRKGGLKILGMSGKSSPISNLVENPDPLIRNNLRIEIGLLTEMILEGKRGSILFQSNINTASKVKDGKEVTKPCLIVFDLPKIIHPFQGKKYLRNL